MMNHQNHEIQASNLGYLGYPWVPHPEPKNMESRHNYRLCARPERFTDPLGSGTTLPESFCCLRDIKKHFGCGLNMLQVSSSVHLKKGNIMMNQSIVGYFSDKPVCYHVFVSPPRSQKSVVRISGPGTPGASPHRAMEVQRTLAVEVLSTHKTCSGPFKCLKLLKIVHNRHSIGTIYVFWLMQVLL